MGDEKPAEKFVLTLTLPESLAKRLSLAASRANHSLADTVLEILDRNLPRTDKPPKRVPYG
jgi:hypothetical protein